MPFLPKTTLHFLAELPKHQAKKQFGDGALTVLTGALTDYAGESASENLTAFLESGQNAEKILAAFRQADLCFSRLGNPNYAQIIASKPFAALERLEKLAARFTAQLDSEALLPGIQEQLQADWGDKYPTEFYPQAARDYRTCLERALATATGDLLPAIFAKVERVDEKTDALLTGQAEIKDMLQKAIPPHPVSQPDETPPEDDNPFLPLSGRITDPQRVFDRERELRQALDYLRGSGGVAFIGESGMGKSSLLTKLLHHVPDAFGWETALLDLQLVEDENDFYERLCAALGVPTSRGYRPPTCPRPATTACGAAPPAARWCWASTGKTTFGPRTAVNG